MVRSIAVLSDIHGVLPSLDAVLAEPDVQDAGAVVVTGDLAAGPQPVAVLDRLAALGDRVRLVRGNADRDLVTAARAPRPPDGIPPVSIWAASQIQPRHVDLLASLPHQLTLDVDGLGRVLFCHGSPRDDDEVLLVDTRPSKWAEAFEGLPDDVRVVCCGHTHMPFVRLVDRRWVVNSGSVGMPYGSTGVPWTLLDEHGIHVRRTAIDPEALARAVAEGSTYPEIREWVRDYVLAPATDVDAVLTFAHRDGRDAGWNG